MAEPIYFKTDKNGTKYYRDYTCQRCGGYGFSKAWLYTGGICYACGGTGKSNRAHIIKEYTPEMLEKMREEDLRTRDERESREIRERMENLSKEYKRFGCDENGIGFVLAGNTYPVKDQIKALGGKWHIWCWIAPTEFVSDGVKAVRIDLSQHVNEYGVIVADDAIFDAMQEGKENLK